MRVTFKLFAMLQDYLPAERKKGNAVVLDDLKDGTTILQVIERFGVPLKSCHLVLVDGYFVPPDQRGTRALKEGETLAIWPPIAGG